MRLENCVGFKCLLDGRTRTQHRNAVAVNGAALGWLAYGDHANLVSHGDEPLGCSRRCVVHTHKLPYIVLYRYKSSPRLVSMNGRAPPRTARALVPGGPDRSVGQDRACYKSVRLTPLYRRSTSWSTSRYSPPLNADDEPAGGRIWIMDTIL